MAQRRKNKRDEMSPVTMTLPTGRLSFPSLHRPDDRFDEGAGKFKTGVFFEGAEPPEGVMDAIHEAWGGTDIPEDGIPLKRTEESDPVAGWKLTAKTGADYPPRVYGPDKTRLAKDEIEEAAYGGRRATLRVAFKAYSGFGGGVSARLNGVLLRDGGEKFGGGDDWVDEVQPDTGEDEDIGF